jgi:hypothetical protein
VCEAASRAAAALRGCTCVKVVFCAPLRHVQRRRRAPRAPTDFGFGLAATRAVALCNFHANCAQSAGQVAASTVS